MLLAHSGIAILLIGISLSTAYSVHQELRMTVGDDVFVGSYQFHFLGTQERYRDNYKTTVADILVSKAGKPFIHLKPERRRFIVQGSVLSKVAIDVGVFRDIYVALGDPLDTSSRRRGAESDTWSFRIYIKPFVRWIWYGGLVMVFGGFLALFSRKKGYEKN